MAPGGNNRTNQHVSITLPQDIYRALEKERESLQMNRSAFYERALRAYLEVLDDEERERRDRLGAKVDKLAELVVTRADDLQTRLSQRTSDLAALSVQERRAAERIYALLEAQFAHALKLSYDEADEAAKSRIREERRSSG